MCFCVWCIGCGNVRGAIYSGTERVCVCVCKSVLVLGKLDGAG